MSQDSGINQLRTIITGIFAFHEMKNRNNRKRKTDKWINWTTCLDSIFLRKLITGIQHRYIYMEQNFKPIAHSLTIDHTMFEIKSRRGFRA